MRDRRRKGQMEFIVILGIVVVLVFVAWYAYSSGVLFPTPVPQGVEQDKKLVEDAIRNIARDGAGFSIKWLEQQGGYIAPDFNNSMVFNKVAVAYWQKCADASMVPTLAEMATRLQDAVKNYINYSLHEKTAYFSKNVSFDLARISVSANILSNKVDFSVYLPTIVAGYSIPQPYTFSVPTKLGEIYEFGRNFAEENARERFMEHFTIATIYFSSDIETQGALTECGQAIYQSGKEISSGLYNSITYTLANTIWWQPMPKATSSSKVYSVESVNGKTYPQFRIGFYLPDRFFVPESGPMFIHNFDVSAFFTGPLFPWVIPVCFTAYDWRYSFMYPLIVRVGDDLTGNYVNFAVLTEVEGLLPGNCSEKGAGPAAPAPELNCSAEIRVTSRNGSPLEGASSTFGDYPVGISGRDGVTSGSILCGMHELVIYKQGYDLYVRNVSSYDINGAYALFSKPKFGIYFKEVDIKDVDNYTREADGIKVDLNYTVCSSSWVNETALVKLKSGPVPYFVSNIAPVTSISDLSLNCLESTNCKLCTSDITRAGNEGVCLLCESECNPKSWRTDFVSVGYVPEGQYNITADIWNFGEFRPEGSFITEYYLPGQETNLFLYIPLGRLYSNFTDYDRELITNKLDSECGMMPIVRTEQKNIINMSGCSCAQLKGMIERELDSCIGQNQINTMFSQKSANCATGSCLVWDCSKSNAISAINGCRFEVLGCG